MNMKLRFLAAPFQPLTYAISGTVINGFDLSIMPEDAEFLGSEDLRSAGIVNVEWINSELCVTLAQKGTTYECQPVSGSHDWRGTGEWVDAADYDPDHCYIVATSAPEGAEYVKRENGWTVVLPEQEKEQDE